MNVDPNLLLTLVAVRILGGQAAPAGAESLKALKKFVKEATDKGWLKEDTVTEAVPVEGGKPKTKKVPVVALTEEGESVLHKAASAEVLAATQSSHLQALRQRLEAGHEALKAEVTASLGAAAKAGKEEDKVAKELAKISQAMHDLVGKVAKLEGLQPRGGGAETVLSTIEAAFSGLKSKVETALKGVTSVVAPALAPKATPEPRPAAPAPSAEHKPAAPAAPAKPAEKHPAPAHEAPKHEAPKHEAPKAEKHPAPAPAPKPVAPTENTVTDVLHRAYEHLKAQPKYQDANVDLPALYHEAQKGKADLSVGEFHKTLVDLEDRRKVTLSFHQDSKGVADADKCINRHGKLVYYVYWFRD